MSDECTEASDAADTTKYYNIAEDNAFSSPRRLTLRPLRGIPTSSATRWTAWCSRPSWRNGDLTGATGDGFTIAAGGAAGDKSVVFRLGSGASVATTTTKPSTLDGQFAISAAGSGSATRTMTNQSLAGLNLPGVSRYHDSRGVRSHQGRVGAEGNGHGDEPDGHGRGTASRSFWVACGDCHGRIAAGDVQWGRSSIPGNRPG